MDEQALRQMLDEYALAHRADAILALRRPCLWLAEEDGCGRSRLGGDPDLPSAVPWPRMDDRDLAFVGQLDLAEVSLGPLPRDGRLLFFYEPSGDYDGIDPCRVLHVRDAPTRRAPPDGVATYEEHRLVAREAASFPHLGPESPYLDLLAESRNERVAVHDWSSMLDEELGRLEPHQLLGYPRGTQRDILRTAAHGFLTSDPASARPTVDGEARRLQNLLQLSAWPGGYGEATLSFVIREDDLRASRFDRVWAVLELG